jgi:hypothetical protein
VGKLSLLFIIVLPALFGREGRAQVGLGGFNAVITVPTGRLVQDGYAAIGVGYIPRPYALYEGPDHNNLAYFASIGFLPFLELDIRATLSIDTDYPSIGDRMISVRAQLLKETRRWPALAIGLHDIAGLIDRSEGPNNYFTALYVAATKTKNLSSYIDLESTLGYGVDWIKAPSHEFDDLFGGVSVGFDHVLFIKAEHDTRRFNLGLGVNWGAFLSTNIVLMNGNKMAFGANITTRL